MTCSSWLFDRSRSCRLERTKRYTASRIGREPAADLGPGVVREATRARNRADARVQIARQESPERAAGGRGEEIAYVTCVRWEREEDRDVVHRGRDRRATFSAVAGRRELVGGGLEQPRAASPASERNSAVGSAKERRRISMGGSPEERASARVFAMRMPHPYDPSLAWNCRLALRRVAHAPGTLRGLNVGVHADPALLVLLEWEQPTVCRSCATGARTSQS